VLDDNGFVLNESRAIMQYLANAYAKNDSLYPKAAKKRAVVDQRLQFDFGTLYKSLFDVYIPIMFLKKPLDQEKVDIFKKNLDLLEGFLSQSKYVAGDSLTIADMSIMATLSTAESSGQRLTSYPLITAYMNRCKAEIKGYDENQKGADIFGAFVKKSLEGN